MTDAHALADAYFDYRQSTDLFRLFSFGQVDNLDRWEDVSSASLAERQDRLREFADEAEVMLQGGTDIDLADRVLLDSIVFTARSGAIQLQQRTEQALVNPAFGFHNTLLTFIGRFALGTAEHGAAYLDKRRNLPALFEAMAIELRTSAADGRVALERHLNASASTIENRLASPTGPDDPLCAQPAPTELDEAAAAEWMAERDRIVADEVRPALAAHAAVLRELAGQGRSDEAAGIMHTNGGVELYDELVWSHTTLDLTPQQIHQIGLDQVAKLAEEYVAIAGPIFELDNVDDILTHLRDEPSATSDLPSSPHFWKTELLEFRDHADEPPGWARLGARCKERDASRSASRGAGVQWGALGQ